MKEALRFNEGKPKLSYFMRSFRWMTAAVARVKEFGANKYEEDNWRAGNKPDEEYLDSFMRHIDAFFSGEFYDPDSGCSHLALGVWNLSAMAELNYSEMPVIDEDLFRERMAYWAERKRLRKEMASLEPTPEEWANSPEGIQTAFGSKTFCHPFSCSDPGAECPQCGSEDVHEGKHGKECECGEIFDAPIKEEEFDEEGFYLGADSEGKEPKSKITFHLLPMTDEQREESKRLRGFINDFVSSQMAERDRRGSDPQQQWMRDKRGNLR